MAKTDGFIWYELITPDPEAAASFYGTIIGWTIEAQAETVDGIDYRMIVRDDAAAPAAYFG